MNLILPESGDLYERFEQYLPPVGGCLAGAQVIKALQHIRPILHREGDQMGGQKGALGQQIQEPL